LLQVNPSKLEKPEDVKKNFKHLFRWTKKIANAIFVSLNQCPVEFREIFHHMQAKVQDNYASDQVAVTKYTVVSGFIFLRFFCPAILGPKLFNLMDEHPSVETNRTLILIAKSLQNLSNLVEFTTTSKEEYMACMNEFVLANLPRVKEFIDELASPVATELNGTIVSPYAVEKEFASLHRHVRKNLQKITELAQEVDKARLNDLITILEKLQIAEDVEQKKLQNKN